MNRRRIWSTIVACGVLVCLLAASPLAAQEVTALAAAEAAGGEALQAVQQSAVARMPVKEVTVFKDGHAFVLHEGTLPTDEKGNVHLDYLPTPVIGTFWPYSAKASVKLTSVSAAKQRVKIQRTALEVRELLEANIGAKVHIKEGERTYAATIVGVPVRSAEELEATAPANSGPQLPQKGQVILLQTTEGTKAVPIDTIREVTFVDPPKREVANEEFRNLLTLHLDWPEGKKEETAAIGMTYLQKGIRWIPQYKVTVDGEGNAVVQLQATLLNEMTDLENVTANLVIGVPSFDFKGTNDPISLSEAVAQLSQYFQENSQMAYGLSNSMMTQVARMGDIRGQPPVQAAEPNLGPEIANTGASEDLYIFTISGVTLKKGQRMVASVAEFKLPYSDVYSLDIPFAPPPELQQQLRGNVNTQQQAELAKLFHAPKVIHKVRLQNSAPVPLTTAPAMIVKDGKVLGQGMMTYTSPGAAVDLKVTTAVSVAVQRTDTDAKRTPNAANYAGNTYDRIDLAGSIKLTNHGKQAILVDVERMLLGTVDSADANGSVVRLDGREESIGAGSYPVWWHWYSWPGWWHHLNTASRISWQVEIEPGKTAELPYKWHYFWRW